MNTLCEQVSLPSTEAANKGRLQTFFSKPKPMGLGGGEWWDPPVGASRAGRTSTCQGRTSSRNLRSWLAGRCHVLRFVRALLETSFRMAFWFMVCYWCLILRASKNRSAFHNLSFFFCSKNFLIYRKMPPSVFNNCKHCVCN